MIVPTLDLPGFFATGAPWTWKTRWLWLCGIERWKSTGTLGQLRWTNHRAYGWKLEMGKTNVDVWRMWVNSKDLVGNVRFFNIFSKDFACSLFWMFDYAVCFLLFFAQGCVCRYATALKKWVVVDSACMSPPYLHVVENLRPVSKS